MANNRITGIGSTFRMNNKNWKNIQKLFFSIFFPHTSKPSQGQCYYQPSSLWIKIQLHTHMQRCFIMNGHKFIITAPWRLHPSHSQYKGFSQTKGLSERQTAGSTEMAMNVMQRRTHRVPPPEAWSHVGGTAVNQKDRKWTNSSDLHTLDVPNPLSATWQDDHAITCLYTSFGQT